MQSKKKITGKHVAIIAIVLFFVATILWFVYYQYQTLQTTVLPRENFTVTRTTTSLEAGAEAWLNGFLRQYQQPYLPFGQRLQNWSINTITVGREEEYPIVHLEFVIHSTGGYGYFSSWGGVEEDGMHCYWDILMQVTPTEENEYTFSYIGEYSGVLTPTLDAPYLSKARVYKIENDSVFITYTYGNEWTLVPESLEVLNQSFDGYQLYSLQEGSYLITPNKTAFVYGGGPSAPLSILYTDDGGANWHRSVIAEDFDQTRVRFCSFPTQEIGYVVVGGYRTMGQEMQAIYKTTNGGLSWELAGSGPETRLLQEVGFVTPEVGFISYPPNSTQNPNGTTTTNLVSFYRTADGGQSFQPVELPPVTAVGNWDEEFFSQVFIAPKTPYQVGENLVLLVG